MTDQDAGIRRSRQALENALAGDAPEHPGYEAIEAYVDGTLDAAERARIEALAERSTAVAEDIADLEEVRRAIGDRRNPVPVRSNIRWVGLAAAVAASVVAAIVLRSFWDDSVTKVTDTNVTQPAPMFAGVNLTNEERTLVENAVTTGTVNVPASVVALAGKKGTLLGAAESRASFGPVTPTATAVLSPRPTFEWSAGDADRYTIAIFDDTFTEVARGTRVSGTTWTPATDLPRGATYRWQVTAHRASGDVTVPVPPQPEARFSIVDAQTADAVRGQRERLSHVPLALGVLLADAGLLVDARAELLRAIEVPATAEAAKKLLGSIAPDQGTPTTTKPAQ